MKQTKNTLKRISLPKQQRDAVARPTFKARPVVPASPSDALATSPMATSGPLVSNGCGPGLNLVMAESEIPIAQSQDALVVHPRASMERYRGRRYHHVGTRVAQLREGTCHLPSASKPTKWQIPQGLRSSEHTGRGGQHSIA